VVGYFRSKATRCAWLQKAKSEVVAVSEDCGSFVVSHPNVAVCYINMHKFLVIAHRYIKHVRKCVHSVTVLACLPQFDL
jgi:hypothetical protein